MVPYLGNKFIPNFVDPRRGFFTRGRGAHRGSQTNGHGHRNGRDRSRSPARHSDGGRYKPYRRYEDDGRSDQGARSAPSRGPPANTLNCDGLEVKKRTRSDSGLSEQIAQDPKPVFHLPVEPPQPHTAATPIESSQSSLTISGLDSLEKLRQFKRQVEASRQANANQELDTRSLAKMAELFLKQQKGEDTEDPVVSQIINQVPQLETGSQGANQANGPTAMERAGIAPEESTGLERLTIQRSDSAPAILSANDLGVNVVPTPSEPGEIKEETGKNSQEREAILKERLRERHQLGPNSNGKVNSVGHATNGCVDERRNSTCLGHRLASPKTNPEECETANGPELSFYERNAKNFQTYRSLPADSPEAWAARHGPRNHYHPNDRSRSPEKMSRSTWGDHESREHRQESRGDQMLRQMAQENGTRASHMSPTKTHHQPPWEQRKNPLSQPNGYHHRQYDREGDMVMLEDHRSPWRDSFLREPFKASKPGQNGASRGPSPPRQPRPFPDQGRRREPEAREPPMPRSSSADHEILATLAGLKAQIAKLEAQLPSASPTAARPIPNGPNHRSQHEGSRSDRHRSPEKAGHLPGMDHLRSRTLSGSQSSHPYQSLSPRRPSNGSTRPRQSYEDARPPWKGTSASSYSRDDTMKRRDEDRYGGYKVFREGSEYRYEFVPANRQNSQNVDRDGGYDPRQRSESGSHGSGGEFRERGRASFRGRGGY